MTEGEKRNPGLWASVKQGTGGNKEKGKFQRVAALKVL